ncbi:MAG: hypothetical protein PF495_12600, partial [Spirochaetales bacterium]|jgi:hypothetical protein|nr:hypothetical protein [Spirochaetales bacterium]
LLKIYEMYDMRYWIAIFLLTLICFRGAHAGDDISGSANLTYRSSKTKTGEEEKSSWGFTQNYNLRVNKEFTPKVNFAANLGINVNETNDTKTTLLTPDIRLNLRNEYFNADTGYRITEKGLDILTMVSDEDRLTTESWNVNFSTKSEKYPKVRLRYNEDLNYDHLTVHETNTKTTNFSGSADYTYRFLDFNYDYRNNVSDNYVTESVTETDTNEGRVNFRKSFWENKIATSGSYSITNRKTATKTGGQEVRIGITHQNIGVKLDPAKEVDRIYLYTTTPDSAFDKNNFTWAVYYSSDNSTWDLITSAAGFDYDTIWDRFEISFTATTALYFKVVNTTNDTNNLYVTEIEAYDDAASVGASDGLYVQDDTPLWSTLNSLPDLVDSNKTTSANINIGD